CASLVAIVTPAPPANAQFWGGWGGWGRPPQPVPQQQQRPQPYNPFGGLFAPSPGQREGPVDSSHAPNPQKKPDPSALTPVVVIGDGMADWLAYGLEEAFGEKPEFAILRKHRTTSGL